MMFFLAAGYRVIAHDRRGHGRSGQPTAATIWTLIPPTSPSWSPTLDLKNAIHVGHSTGGEVAPRGASGTRTRGKGRVDRCRTTGDGQERVESGGTPIEVFDGFRAALAANRAQLYLDIPSGPFYGFNRAGAKVSKGSIRNWWRQGMMGSVKAGYECIKAFSTSLRI